MNQTSPWETQEVAEVFNQAFRTIDNMCPPLRKYLTPGSNILDVGCASGRFSRDVAIMIDSGILTGVDHSETSISLAQAEAQKAQITNAKFLVRDAYSLGFADDTFDLTYSMNVAVWLQDPLRAIQEQRRVTKPGGWVAVQMADYGNIIWYPPAPTVDFIINSLANVRNLPEGERVIDSHQARRALEIMAQAGFENAQIDGWVSIITSKSDRFDEHFDIWKTLWLSSDGMGEFLHKVLLSHGLTDESVYETARAELDAWHAHPHAIYMQTSYLVAAQVS
ncbi:MAG: methyltransferase domain-containing protein [Caldilineaceae bacterium]|nr:methyltransferase domain-containing protein [Caldilineaceae bacterium]